MGHEIYHHAGIEIVTTSDRPAVMTLFTSACPVEGMVKVSTEPPEQVAVSPVRELLSPLRSISATAYSEVVVIKPVTESVLLNVKVVAD